jgi:carbon starvation protein
MPLSLIAFAVCAVLLAAYLVYGRLLGRLFGLRDAAPTPAHTLRDDNDFAPVKPSMLLAQHFSAIAAAGPIVGPILAGAAFGWLPALLWIVLGSVFFGAVHDCSSLVGSVRRKAASIAVIVGEQMGGRAYKLFTAFVWLSLVYVITAFTDITAASFAEPTYGGGVAASSTAYLLLGLAMGVALAKGRWSLKAATAVFMPLVVLSIWYGQSLPIVLSHRSWNFLILAYCAVASLLPLWLLVQPRGYMGGFFLYGTLAAGVIGMFLAGDQVRYPAFLGFTSASGMPLFPILFVTVACGACSGFHGLVCSGTTSKQVDKETDCRLVGYGGMLLEGLVAVIALATVMLLPKGSPVLAGGPDRVYAEGLAHFVEQFGFNPDFARSFALLAFATFIYDTLDVATRLGRYMLQELTGWKGRWGAAAGTVLTLALPAVFVSATLTGPDGRVVPAWKMFWTVFGTSNQLLAGLTLLAVSLWLKRAGRAWLVTAVPMAFMMTMTLWALGRLMAPLASGRLELVPVVALLLGALALLLIWESVRALFSAGPAPADGRLTPVPQEVP